MLHSNGKPNPVLRQARRYARTRTKMKSHPNYEKAYWKAIEIREKIGSSEIKIPFARSETHRKLYDLLSEIAEAPWQAHSTEA